MTDQQTPYYATPRQPRLIWNDRDKRKAAEPLPTQTVEIIRPFYSEVKEDKQGQSHAQGALEITSEAAPENRLIWTNDNLVALTSLLHGDAHHAPLEGKVDLVYIDPPFAVQSDFKINVEIENGLSDEKLPTLIEEIAYKDTWKDGLDSYLSMMRDRLELLKRLLAPTGSIYVHCDWHAGHYLKVLLDEVFGYENYINEVVWQKIRTTKAQSLGFGNVHDVIFLYRKGENTIYHKQITELDPKYIKSHYKPDAKSGRLYRTVSLLQKGIGPARNFGGQVLIPPSGMHWIWSQERIDKAMAEGLIRFTSNNRPEKIQFLDDIDGDMVDDLWTDIYPINSQAIEALGYPTQKPEALLERIISASSNPDALVLDCFSGSGTTAAVAEKLDRRWIAIDNGKFAIHLTRKRLIEANARPFAVENVGFYARNEPWQDKYAKSASAKLYRDAMVEVYGGAPVEGFAYLHGRKGNRWVHVGPMNAPVVESQLTCIAEEAAATDTRSVDVLSADIDIDFNKGEIEQKHGVKVQAKIIPQAAIDAVRERLRRKRAKDPKLDAAPDIHFFSPPDVEVRAVVAGGGVTVTLTRLTVDLDDCLSTQDAAKRAEIKKRITDWKALVDYWAVDWDYDGRTFQNDWQTFRTRKSKEIAPQAAHTYADGKGDKRIAVKVTDIFGNDGLKVIRVTV